MGEHSAEQIVRRNGPSDHQQWVDQAVRQYEGPLMAYAAHLLGSAERAGDIVQETFCRLCRARRAEVDSHLAKWLYTVCRNCALDVLRKERRMRPLVEPMVEASGNGRHAASTPADHAERQEANTLVTAALADLPERQQELVRLKFQHGLSYKQMADVTGLSVSNVGFLLHTAIKTLRTQLATGEEQMR